MTITIPIWLLWTIGLLVAVPIIAFILMLAWIGWATVNSLKGIRW